jgi:hypothetical protein
MKLYNILFENFNIEKEMYGSNFLYNVDKYNQLTGDGLPKYGITFSEFEKWGVNPGGKWFPRGVYFYYMHPKCKEYGIEGTGFASGELPTARGCGLPEIYSGTLSTSPKITAGKPVGFIFSPCL